MPPFDLVVKAVVDRYFYIYNRFQAKFFIDSGLKVLDIGVGKYGDVYHKFARDAESEDVFNQWKAGAGMNKDGDSQGGN